MAYSERAYFDGDHCAHCAARDEFMRLARIRVSAIVRLTRVDGATRDYAVKKSWTTF